MYRYIVYFCKRRNDPRPVIITALYWPIRIEKGEILKLPSLGEGWSSNFGPDSGYWKVDKVLHQAKPDSSYDQTILLVSPQRS